MKYQITVFLVVVILFDYLQHSSGQKIYISPDGNDSGSGTF